MSDEPKKRGRPRKDKSQDLLRSNSSNETLLNISDLSEDQKRELLKNLNEQLGIKESKETRGRKGRFFENTFVDDKTLCVEDMDFTKKVKFTVGERSRKSTETTAVCERCRKEFLKYGGEYLCNSCGSTK